MCKVKVADFCSWVWGEWPAVSETQRFGQAFYNKFATPDWEPMPELFSMTDTKKAQWYIIDNLLEE